MTEQQEIQIFQLISTAGTAKSMYMEAIKKAKEGNYEEARSLIKQGEDCYMQGHHIHGSMITDVTSYVNLILAHAEDQMMNAETIRLIAEEIIELYEKIDNK